MVNENLKVGDKLYSIDYFSTGREWTTYTISKINRETVSMKGYNWKIRKDEIGDEYFTSKEELLKIKIQQHEDKISDLMTDEIMPVKKEIEYLKNKLNHEQKASRGSQKEEAKK